MQMMSISFKVAIAFYPGLGSFYFCIFNDTPQIVCKNEKEINLFKRDTK
jgi:hypothetical protein